MKITLQCQCGAVKGYTDTRYSYGHAVCYCVDCQAFAKFLAHETLNSRGGTEVFVTLPGEVHFTAGADKIACMSLSGKGLLRWYASCCGTPIGNTPRDPKLAYVGLVSTSLPTLHDAVGPPKIALNTESATGHVKATPFATFFGVARIMWNLAGARLNGAYKNNPFFKTNSNEPIKVPRVLTKAERDALRDDSV